MKRLFLIIFLALFCGVMLTACNKGKDFRPQLS